MQADRARRERGARSDHDAARTGVEPHDIKRLARGDPQALPLPDGEMDDAVVAAEHLARQVHDVARLGRARPQPLDHVRIAARSGRSRCPGCPACRRSRARTRAQARARAPSASRRAESAARRVAPAWWRTGSSSGRGPDRARDRAPWPPSGEAAVDDVVAGRQHLRAEVARGAEQVGELDRAVALDARHRRLARRIAFGEAVDHGFLEARLVVEHVMRDADPLRDRARVMDVAPGAAGALAMRRGAVVVKLQGDADDVIALGLEQGGRHRGIDAAGHGDDDPRVLRTAFGIEAVEHAGIPISRVRPSAMMRRFRRTPAVLAACCASGAGNAASQAHRSISTY